MRADVPRRAPREHPGLYTDMYHPDAAYVSWLTGRNGETTFDLYTRTAPFGGAYLLVAGLEMALEFVQSFCYSEEELAVPRPHPRLRPRLPRRACQAALHRRHRRHA